MSSRPVSRRDFPQFTHLSTLVKKTTERILATISRSVSRWRANLEVPLRVSEQKRHRNSRNAPQLVDASELYIDGEKEVRCDILYAVWTKSGKPLRLYLLRT